MKYTSFHWVSVMTGIRSRQRKVSSVRHRVQTGSGTHPVSYVMDNGGPGCEADHSFPSVAEVKDCVKLYLHFPVRHGAVLS
jgi:hypothetical protein